MLPQKSRLPVQRTHHFRPERTISGDFFTVRVYRGGEINRFGVVISAKVDKKSVRRHFWKRRIMDAVILWPNIRKDFVIIVSPHLAGASSLDLARSLQFVGKKISQMYQ